ncbi:MAG: BMA_0021/BMA_0022 family TOMM bacteriocin [Curvibacter sp.]|nr:BMA_0021/BMA_0022 family TOMM bacteriocin [Curvibacter sp.]
MSNIQIQAGEPMLEFRLAYLRAVARSWQDEGFRDRLLDATDIQPLLAKEFGLRTVWPYLDISLQRSGDPNRQTVWKPLETAGWIGVDDAFEIVLPESPSAQATEALAAYYQLFPDFMGPTGVIDSGDQGSGKGQLGGSLPTGLGIPGGGADSMLAFGGVVLRAIALAWENARFRAELLEYGKTDATQVLSQWLGYNSPFNFFLRFSTNPALHWDAAQGQWNLKNPNGGLIKNSIVLNYPNAPVETQLWPIALTSYNNTGSAYPFTC